MDDGAMSHQPPRTSDPLELLLMHNAWATREVLKMCIRLDDEQWRRRFDIGPGSLHDTLTHIIGAMLGWADRIDGAARMQRPSIEKGEGGGEGMPRRTAAELLVLLESAEADLSASAARARARGLGTVEEMKFGEKVYHFTLGAMLVHVTTHGMHHRAQCLNMLRRLNVPGISDQLPDLDVLEWQAAVETGQLAAR
jgi:uncharacterized damage-inducible protein DinB